MILDSQLAFVPLGGNQSLVAAAGTSIPSINTIDILGVGVGQPPPDIIGNATLFGQDSGVGAITPFIQVSIGTACTTSTSATLNVALQSAPDTASTFLPGTWTTIEETGAVAVASLTAGQVLRLLFQPTFPQNQRPRYLRLLFQVPSATSFTAGTVSSAVVTMARDDLAIRNATKNFTVA